VAETSCGRAGHAGRDGPELESKWDRTMPLARSPSELREASSHVWYEIWMALSVAQVLSSPLFGPGVCTNASLESFTLHARTLVGFFFGGKTNPADMVASDFFDEPRKWQRLRGKKDPVLMLVGPRVGKEIAHLSYDRLGVTPEAKAWDVPAIAKAIRSLADTFRNAVAPELLSPKWRRG
jgi:hypothetical protein